MFDNPVNYRYYKLNHMTSNAQNGGHDYCSIAELEFSKVNSMSYIKYEPTYYMELNQAAYINEYCDYYDTNERIVGRWVDGKPVYRKVFNITLNRSAGNTDVATGVSIQEVVDVRGIVHVQSQYCEPFPNSVAGTNRITVYDNNFSTPNTIRVVNNSNVWVGQPFIIVLDYTKTTDAQNSFDYGMIINQFAQEALVDVAVTDAEVDKCFE